MPKSTGENIIWAFLLGLTFGSALTYLLSTANFEELLEKLGIVEPSPQKKIEKTRRLLEKLEKNLE